jgi:hypothetical protein
MHVPFRSRRQPARESVHTVRCRLDAPMQRVRREPNTACFEWEGPELEISAARLAALRVSSVPPGRYRDRPIPRPTLSQSTIRPYQLMLFSGALHIKW